MSNQSELIGKDILAYLKSHENKDLLRFITCGSVDDGKSTLIGRLLWDSKLIFEDHLATLKADSKKLGTQGEDIDFALLLDGLQAEREQGITIDVAYRFFSTEKRKFIVADTPGHEQYTRNMATGASTADAAVILADAQKGILTQTKRHSTIVSLMGIRHVLLAVNKMDLVDYSQETFNKITAEYRKFTKDMGFVDVTCVPVSALKGDNIITASANTSWYHGPSLLAYLETVEVDEDRQNLPFRMPVQIVSRPDRTFRGFAGTIASGTIKPGDMVAVPSSGQTSTVKEIVTLDGKLDIAIAGQSVTLTLTDETDISRGDILSASTDRPDFADQFQARLIWMNEKPLLPGRAYQLKIGTTETKAQITALKHRLNVNTLEKSAAKTLGLNEVGCINVSLGKSVAFDSYNTNRHTGRFILIDRFTNATVAAGMIDYPLRRASNIHWQDTDIDKGARAEQKAQKPCVLWFTGLSGSGKSSIANLVEKKLFSMGKHTYLLDGDNVRHGLNRDLGFTPEDRVENIRRISETAKLFVDAGLIVLTAFISPYRNERRIAREMMGNDEFVGVYVNTPIDVCEQRDPKGLYKKARAGELKNFTGIDAPYEPPEMAEIEIKGEIGTPEDHAEQVCKYLQENGYI